MNIFVAKLSRNTTAEDLTKLFEAFGEVRSSKLIYDRTTGTSKGYGFVEMATEEAADQAISSLNETTFQEAVIIVKKAHPREERPPQRRTPIIKRAHATDSEEEQTTPDEIPPVEPPEDEEPEDEVK